MVERKALRVTPQFRMTKGRVRPVLLLGAQRWQQTYAQQADDVEPLTAGAQQPVAWTA